MTLTQDELQAIRDRVQEGYGGCVSPFWYQVVLDRANLLSEVERLRDFARFLGGDPDRDISGVVQTYQEALESDRG